MCVLVRKERDRVLEFTSQTNKLPIPALPTRPSTCVLPQSGMSVWKLFSENGPKNIKKRKTQVSGRYKPRRVCVCQRERREGQAGMRRGRTAITTHFPQITLVVWKVVPYTGWATNYTAERYYCCFVLIYKVYVNKFVQ